MSLETVTVNVPEGARVLYVVVETNGGRGIMALYPDGTPGAETARRPAARVTGAAATA